MPLQALGGFGDKWVLRSFRSQLALLPFARPTFTQGSDMAKKLSNTDVEGERRHQLKFHVSAVELRRIRVAAAMLDCTMAELARSEILRRSDELLKGVTLPEVP